MLGPLSEPIQMHTLHLINNCCVLLLLQIIAL